MTKKKYDVIVIGELNVDIILNNLDSYPEIGKEKLAQSMNLTLGSSSAIFACNLSSLGAKVAFIGNIGNDYFGQLVLDKLNEKGVDVRFITKDQNLNTGATIVLNFNNDRAMITYSGAMNSLTINDISEKTLELGNHLHFSSFFLQPGLKQDIYKVFRMAKNLNMTTSFDMQWDPAEKWEMNYKEILPFVDVFLPNEKEILNLTKESSIAEALNNLSGYANNILVKMGTKGSLLYYKGKTNFRQAYLNSEIADAIGAGDSFNAGFIFKYINHADLKECQEFGNLMGAINTTAAGGTTAFINYENIMKVAKEKFGYQFE